MFSRQFRNGKRARLSMTFGVDFCAPAIELGLIALFVLAGERAFAQSDVVIIRPKEIRDVLVNPGMGITTFQRFNGQALNPPLTWSEEGPTERLVDAEPRPEFPPTSVSAPPTPVRTRMIPPAPCMSARDLRRGLIRPEAPREMSRSKTFSTSGHPVAKPLLPRSIPVLSSIRIRPTAQPGS